MCIPLNKIKRKIIYGSINRLFEIFLQHFLNAASGVCQIPIFFKDQIRSEQALSKDSVRFKGRWIESVETRPNNEMELVQRIISSFCASKKMQLNVPRPYLANGGWKDFLAVEWRRYYDAILHEDYKTIAALLRNFFRNEAIDGLWGAEDVFTSFCSQGKFYQLQRENFMKNHYLVWKHNFPFIPLKELDAPRIGNPWGYRFNDMLLYEPVLEYNYQAHYFHKLLHDIEIPVIIEIGGGFGGLAHHLLRCRPSVKYVGFDLPENILIQTYYLSCAFPNAKMLIYQENTPPLNREQLNHYDVVLLPNFELPRVESLIADLIVNVRSLSEMSSETITEYLSQIDRIGHLFFYHENIFKSRKDGRFGIPSSDFPALKNFVQIASSESRWPKYNVTSAYPCRENLLIRRDALS